MKRSPWHRKLGRSSRDARRRAAFSMNVESLEERRLLSMTVVKNINPDPAFPANITGVNGNVFYTARATDGGTNLVVATATGSTVLKDFNTAPAYVNSPGVSQLTAVGAKLFFSANGGDGQRLWMSDGTVAGTKPVTSSTTAGNVPFRLTAVLTPAGPKLFYTAFDDEAPAPAHDQQVLFETDGTAAGTFPVPAPPGSADPVIGASNLAAFNGKLYFASFEKLWATNGTSAGTTLVKTVNVPEVGYPNPIANLTVAGTSLYFVADNTAGEPSLWTSNGTTAGTKVLKSITGVTNVNPPGLITSLTRVGTKLFFTVNSSSTGPSLAVTDGTLGGTKVLKALPGTASTYQSYPAVIGSPMAVGNKLFFTTADGTGPTGIALWASDGTAAGTFKIKGISPAVQDTGTTVIPGQFAALNGNLYFANYDSTNGVELWKSNGTTAGTTLLKDINPGQGRSFPGHMAVINGALYFSAFDGTGGNQLWKSNGTAAGTVKYRSLAVAATNDALHNNLAQGTSFAVIGSTMLFEANNGVFGAELWKTDGTLAGTALVKDLLPGPLSSNPTMLTTVGNKVFFVATYQNNGELWVSDGTAAGTIPLIGLSGPVSAMVPFDGKLALLENTGSGNAQLVLSDGTVGGTAAVKSLDSPPVYGPGNLTVFQGKLYFASSNGEEGNEVWSSDGTAGGTTPFDADSGVLNPVDFTVFNSKLYFTDAAAKLWSIDGATAEITDVASPGALGSSLTHLSAVGASLVFFVNIPNAEGPAAVSLWKSDGTTLGTTLLLDLSGDLVRNTTPSVLPGGKIVFEVSTVTGGDPGPFQPWVSDGTVLGTHLLKNVQVDFNYSPGRVINGLLYFSATDDVHGTELWQSDGTTGGTHLVNDISPGAFSSLPTPLASLSGNLLIVADNGVSGFELMTSGNPDPKPPIINPIGNKTVNAGSLLQLTVVAHDTFPGTPLTFSLAPGAPGNATINPTTGVFTWTPVIPQTTTFTVRVSDNSSPPLVTTQTFTVTVNGIKSVVSAGGNASIRVVNSLTRNGSFTIPAYAHVTATVAYGDGTGAKPLTLTPAKTFSLSHKYAKKGRFTVLVSIKDQFGNIGTASFVVTVTA